MRFPTVVVRSDVLVSWLTVSDYTRSRLAQDLGVSKGRVSQLLTSMKEPSAHLIAKLIAVTRLPFERLFKVAQDESSLSFSSNHSSSSTRKAAALELASVRAREYGAKSSSSHRARPTQAKEVQ